MMKKSQKINQVIKDSRDAEREKILKMAEELYVEKLLTIGEAVEEIRKLGYPLAMWRFSKWLNDRGVARSPSKTIIERRKAKIESSLCAMKDCNNTPDGCKRYCKECIPDPTALKAWYDYGITHQKVTEIFESQGNVCAGCKCSLTRGQKSIHKSKNNFCIDHNHETGEIRGILCHYCNTILGLSKDNPETLTRLTSYLVSERRFSKVFMKKGDKIYPLQQPSDQHLSHLEP
jgi:predicted HTH domain antitoxin